MPQIITILCISVVGKIWMENPYYSLYFFSVYAMKLEVPRARWDTHKLNSIENSIWDQTFPRAITTGIIRYKRHLVRFCQNNHNFKAPHPNSYCNKLFLGKPQGHVSLKGSIAKSSFWMLSGCLKMNTGENKTHSFSFHFSLFTVFLYRSLVTWCTLWQ